MYVALTVLHLHKLKPELHTECEGRAEARKHHDI